MMYENHKFRIRKNRMDLAECTNKKVMYMLDILIMDMLKAQVHISIKMVHIIVGHLLKTKQKAKTANTIRLILDTKADLRTTHSMEVATKKEKTINSKGITIME